MDSDDSVADHMFVLKLTDKPGAMELIAATFAHRGLSLSSTLGNDGTLDPDGSATVLVRFRATMARKDALKATLGRLSRVRSLVEHSVADPFVRQAALICLASGSPAPAFPFGVAGTVEVITCAPDTGDTTYALLGPPAAVGALIDDVRTNGTLRGITQTVLAL